MNPTEAPATMTVPWTVRDTGRACALVVGVTLFVALLGAQVVRMLGGPGQTAGLLASATLEGMLLVAIWRFGPWRYGRSWEALGLRARFNNGTPLTLLVLLLSIGFAAVYTAVVSQLGQEGLTPPPLPNEMMETYLQRVATFGLVVVVAPVAEEAFFRGFLLPVFAQQWGFWVGAGFVSLLFGTAHLAPGLMIPAFVSGMLLAWLYRRTGSLWNCVLAHSAQNALAFAVAILV